MNIRETVKGLSGYNAGTAAEGVRMDKNECPFDLPGGIRGQVMERLGELEFNRYPDKLGRPLREGLADHLGVSPSNLVLGNGSDELITYILQLFSGREIVIAPPTFSVYGIYGRIAGYDVKEVPLDESFALRTGEIMEYLDGTAAVFLCSPNNPTGNVVPRRDLIKVLETGTPVVLDEAYWEFAGETNVDLVDRFDNLIVLRTFSKAFGLAGARVGYAVAAERVIEHLLKVKLPYNLNSLSQAAAEVVLDNYGYVEERIEMIVQERERITAEFREYSYPSEANFLLFDLDAKDYLESEGIAVRGFRPPLEDKMRVTVGRKKENDRYIEAIRRYLEDGRK